MPVVRIAALLFAPEATSRAHTRRGDAVSYQPAELALRCSVTVPRCTVRQNGVAVVVKPTGGSPYRSPAAARTCTDRVAAMGEHRLDEGGQWEGGRERERDEWMNG